MPDAIFSAPTRIFLQPSKMSKWLGLRGLGLALEELLGVLLQPTGAHDVVLEAAVHGPNTICKHCTSRRHGVQGIVTQKDATKLHRRCEIHRNFTTQYSIQKTEARRDKPSENFNRSHTRMPDVPQRSDGGVHTTAGELARCAEPSRARGRAR